MRVPSPFFWNVTVTIDSSPNVLPRHPGMLNSTRSIDFDEPPVVGGALQGEQVPEPVDLRIEDQLVILVPKSARDLWIKPRIENLARRRRDCPLNA